LRTGYRAIFVVVGIAFVASVTGVLTNLASSDIAVHGWAGHIGVWLGLAVFSIASAAITYLAANHDPNDPLPQAAKDLRRKQQDRWDGDPLWSSVKEGGRLRVHWRPATGDAFPANNQRWSERKGPSDGARLAALFMASGAPKRLVVLGEGGAGKTELLFGAFQVLLAGWTGDRPNPPPVPVLVPMTAWRPGEHPHSWLVEWLHKNYRFLSRPARGHPGQTLAEALVVEHKLAFLLDGLDEVADDSRHQALKAINDLDPDCFVMLTSRTAEYYGTRRAGDLLTNARGIELRPQQPDQAMRYLKSRSEPPARWVEVENALPHSPVLSQVLGKPLNIMLVDTIYNRRLSGTTRDSAQPADLLAYTDPATLTDHLLGEFLPARYADSTRQGGLRRWGLEDACRGLGYLACMVGAGTDLRWWDLSLLPARRWGTRRQVTLTAVGVVAWTALSAGLLNQWIFTERSTGVTDAVRISAAALLCYLSMLYLTGVFGDAVLGAVGAYIAGVLSGSYDLAVTVGIVIGFSWRVTRPPMETALRRGRFRDAVYVGVAAVLVAAVIRGVGVVLSLTPTLTQGFGGGALDGFVSRWDEDGNGWVATGLVTALTTCAALTMVQGPIMVPKGSRRCRSLVYGLIAGVAVTVNNAWADGFGHVQHAWMAAPADGLAVGLAVWWVSLWPSMWSTPRQPSRPAQPTAVGVLVGVVATGLNIAGYATRTDIHTGWARALDDGIVAGLLVWFALDLQRRPPATGQPETGQARTKRLQAIAAAVPVAAVVGALDTASAGAGRGIATAIGFGLAVLFLAEHRRHKRLETLARRVSPAEVGAFVLILVGIIAGFGYGLMFGVVAGLGCRVTRDIALRAQPSLRARPSAGGVAVGVLLGGVAALGALFNHMRVEWLVLVTLTGIVAGAFAFGIDSKDPDRSTIASPYGLYRRDRAASIRILAMVATAVGIAVGARAMAISGSPSTGTLAAVAALLTYGMTAGLIVSASATRYLTFTVARVRLYYRGHLPWALMPFLDDAHRERLVLRSTGPAYQFRHSELKERIARDSPVSEKSTNDTGRGLPHPRGRERTEQANQTR
jgi:hypothetical protein